MDWNPTHAKVSILKLSLPRPKQLLRPWASLKAAFDRGPSPRTPLGRALRSGGLQGAVALLNGGVPHRYTAVHRLVIDEVTSLAIHDRLGQETAAMRTPVDLGHSFCQYAMRDGIFVTDDSAADRRLDGHPFQGQIATYHGVALTDENGQAFGSLCHFDTRLRFFGVAEFEQMRSAAEEISAFMQRGRASMAEADAPG